MKKIIFSKYLLAIAILCSAFTKIASDIITKLGIEERQAQQHILHNLIGRFDVDPINGNEIDGADPASVYNQLKGFKIPSAKLLPSIISGDKKGAAKELCEYVKNYVNSADFAAAYTKARNAAKPTEEPPVMDKQTIDAMKQGLKESEAARTKLKAMGQPTKSIDDGIAQMKKMIAENGDPTPNKTRWEKLYPENPATAVKQKLEEYLKLAATVDFAAITSGAGKKKIFANAAYEKKSLKWKAIYRAGKEVNDVATAFAIQWLKEGINTH